VGANHSSAPSEVVTSPATKVPHNHEGGPVVASVPDDGAEAGAAAEADDGALVALGAFVAPDDDVAGFAVVGVVPAGAAVVGVGVPGGAVVGAVDPAKARVAWAASPTASPNVRWHTNPCAACAAVGGHG
jgi:hypothetical protein